MDLTHTRLSILVAITAATLSAQQQYGISRYVGAICPANGTNILAWSLSQTYPSRVLPDSTGGYYITYQSSVYHADAGGTLTRVAGNCVPGYSGDAGPATSAQIGVTLDVAVDSSGNLLIADSANSVIRKVTQAGVISTVAGAPGAPGYTGDGGTATGAQIIPDAIATDNKAGYYILQKSSLVIRYVTSGGTIRTAVGTGVSGPPGNGGPASSATLNGPQGIALDGTGNLYITDVASSNGGGNIRKVDTQGIITNFAGNGTAGGAGDGGPAASASVDQPGGITVDRSGNVFFSEDFNGVIRKISPTGFIRRFVSGSGALSSDTSGSIYIGGSHLQVLRADTQGNLFNFAGDGFYGFSGDGGQALNAQLNSPASLGTDKNGNLYLADSGRIRKVTSAGTITTLFEPALTGFPAGQIGVDSNGNVYFADRTNNRIIKVDVNGNFITVAGGGTAGLSGDGGPAATAKLNAPIGVAVDGSDNIYVNDSGNGRFRKIDTTGNISTFAQVTSGTMWADALGNIYNDSGAKITRITPAGVSSVILGTGVPGFSGDGGPASSAQFYNSDNNHFFSLVGDSAGNVYIGDLARRIRRITPTGTIDTIAGAGLFGVTPPASTGDGGPATSGQFNPNGLAIDKSGNLYISDTQATSADGTNFIRKLAPITGTPPTAPSLISPANASTNSVLTPTLSWSASPGATAYDVYVSAGSTSNPALATSVTGTTYQLGVPFANPARGLNPFATYSWKIVAKNASGSSAASTSPVFTFTTGSGLNGSLLTVAPSHIGNFAQGQAQAPYAIVVSNTGTAATSGVVTVTAGVSTGITLGSMSGTGWTCAGTTCTRNDALAIATAYPSITALVSVGVNAPTSVTFTATVSGGSSPTATANDPTTVGSPAGASSVTSLSPITSVGLSQVFTFQFSDTVGYADLSVVNVLINTALDGRQACYLAYAKNGNALYLVSDAGDGTYAGTLVMNGTGSLGNSQCTISGAGSSVTGSGNVLTLTLNMTFSAAFSGNRVIYMAARDSSQNTSGWQTLGVHGSSTTLTAFPAPASMSPASGSIANPTITFTYQDATSAANLLTSWALINTAIDGRSACYVAYYRPGNQVFLYPDNGDGSQATSMVLTGTNTLSNSQCTVSAQGSTVTSSGATSQVTLNIAFKPAFTGPKGVWMAVQTVAGAVSPWQALGAWRVP